MEIKITGEKESPLLKRREISFEVDHSKSATPSKESVRAKLAAMLNAKSELLVVDKYATSCGVNRSTGMAKIYSDKIAMAAELRSTVKKNFEPKQKVQKPEASEAKPEEKKSEEKKPAVAEKPKAEEKNPEPAKKE